MSENKFAMDFLSRLDITEKDRRRFEAVIEEPFEQLFQIFDELPAGYTEVDLKGKLTLANRATQDMSRRTQKELIGLPFQAYTAPESVAKLYQAYNTVFRTGISTKRFIYKAYRSDGVPMVIENDISLKKVNGKVVGFRGLWHDVTERIKYLEELADHRSRLEAILGNLKDGIIAVDATGRVTNANQVVVSICGAPIETAIGNHYTARQPLCGGACHTLFRDTLSKNVKIKDCLIRCDRYDRPHQVILFNGSPLIDACGNFMGAVFALRAVNGLQGPEREFRDRHQFQGLIGKSSKMRKIFDLSETLANVETTVLITGRSGTGKELVAKALHHAGNRAKKPFVKVNCSALNESLLESELFGHVKGAYTGAIKDRQGRFQMADGGTILLDEIGDISPLIQLKLLRVLQEKEFERVGDAIPQKVDVRVVAATNKDLKERVKQGAFREDLYYRLKVMEITLPPLNERLEDLPLLIEHFCSLFNERHQKNIIGVSSDVLTRFMNYGWPGNVRELEHVLEHAFVVCDVPTIMMEHLPSDIRIASKTEFASAQPANTLRIYTGRDVLSALQKTRWNKTEAAKLLGVHRRTIHRKIKQFNLSPFK